MKALVFDLGGVILPLNKPRAEKALADLNRGVYQTGLASLEKEHFFERFETGHIHLEVFVNTLAELTGRPEADVIDAWHAILEPIPPENLDLLTRLGQRNTLFLLSNTNALHWQWIDRHLVEDHGLPGFTGIFKRLFLSYEMGVRKPEPAIYDQVRELTGLPADQLIFIDDHPDNVEAAKSAGWDAVLHPANFPLSQTAEDWL